MSETLKELVERQEKEIKRIYGIHLPSLFQSIRLETAEYIRRRIGTRISCYGMVTPEEVNNIIFNIISELKELK